MKAGGLSFIHCHLPQSPEPRAMSDTQELGQCLLQEGMSEVVSGQLGTQPGCTSGLLLSAELEIAYGVLGK